jgi:hypothetical protein
VSDAFDEVEEKIREERMSKAFKQFAPIAAVLFGLAVLGIGGWEFWKYQQTRTNESFTAAMTAASDLAVKGDMTAAADTFGKLAASGPAGHRALALMQKAGVLVAQGDTDAALKAFDSAAELSAEPILRDSARLNAAYLAADKQTFKEVEPRLMTLINAGGLFQFPARELLAMEALEAGENQRAEDQFKYLTAAVEAPACIQWRAELGLFTLGKGTPPDLTPQAVQRCAGLQGQSPGMGFGPPQ